MLQISKDYTWSIGEVGFAYIKLEYVICTAIFFSFSLLLGWQRKISAIIIWCSLRYLIYKNIFYYGMNYDYLGFLLIISLFVPSGEGFSVAGLRRDWKMPKEVYLAAWFVFTLSMTVSGVNKYVASPEWQQGSALKLLYTMSPVYRSEYFKDLVLGYPTFFKWVNILVLYYEILSIFFLYNRKTRFLYSLMTIALFTSVAALSMMVEVAVTVLIFEVLLIDITYFKKNKKNEKISN